MPATVRQLKTEILQALAHPTRIAIVEALRGGELSAGQIIGKLGLEQANASQHLAVLRARQIVANRKDGNQVFYSLRHPAFVQVLDLLRDACIELLSDSQKLLAEMQLENRPGPGPRRPKGTQGAGGAAAAGGRKRGAGQQS
jgi:ArsR family transcriptional regulator